MPETIPILLKVHTTNVGFAKAFNYMSNSLKAQAFETVFREAALSEEDICAIYPHLPREILNAQLSQFAGRKIGMWLASGEDAISSAAVMKGADNDPARCAPYSWRMKLAAMLGFRTTMLADSKGKLTIVTYDNYVHAPKRDEVERDMAVLGRFFP
ncbi:MAG: hypothetical protein KGI69_02185 [Patescibacteria group bacterium]|nr:hypothetical protein [Patescibacteria group bacterium]